RPCRCSTGVAERWVLDEERERLGGVERVEVKPVFGLAQRPVYRFERERGVRKEDRGQGRPGPRTARVEVDIGGDRVVRLKHVFFLDERRRRVEPEHARAEKEQLSAMRRRRNPELDLSETDRVAD